MLNYPFFSLLRAYVASKFTRKVKIEDETTLSMRCGISDIDPYLEINNGRYQTLADIGRFNHGFRSGFFGKAKKIKSILPSLELQLNIVIEYHLVKNLK